MSQEPTSEPPVPKKRWKFWLGLVVVCLLVGLALLHLHARERARQELRAAVTAQDREGPWRLAELEEARAFVPETINSARLVEQLGDLLPVDWGAAPYSRWTESPTNEMLSEARTEEFRQELQRRHAPLQLARMLADLDRGRFPIQYARNPFTTNLNHANRARQAASLLQLDALLRAREGDLSAALRSCRGMINAGRSMGDEPFSMSQMTRWGAVRTAGMTLERVLGQGEWPEKAKTEVEALQRLLAREARHDGYGISLRGERAIMHQFFEALETGEASFRELGAEFSKLREVESLSTFLHLHRARRLHAQMFSYFRDLIAVARIPRPQRAAQQQAFNARLRQGLPTPCWRFTFSTCPGWKRGIAVTRPRCAASWPGWPRSNFGVTGAVGRSRLPN